MWWSCAWDAAWQTDLCPIPHLLLTCTYVHKCARPWYYVMHNFVSGQVLRVLRVRAMVCKNVPKYAHGCTGMHAKHRYHGTMVVHMKYHSVTKPALLHTSLTRHRHSLFTPAAGPSGRSAPALIMWACTRTNACNNVRTYVRTRVRTFLCASSRVRTTTVARTYTFSHLWSRLDRYKLRLPEYVQCTWYVPGAPMLVFVAGH